MSNAYDRFSEHLTGSRRDDAHEHGSRSRVAKDRDRIIHCGAFRRLQRKSQIVGVQSADFFRTRLTHTIECAQIGRAIAARAKGSDLDGVVDDPAHLPDLIEAACLAHDLGHPPFGHNGEVALAEMMDRHARGMFEANAQSFRIVTSIEPKVYAGGRSCGLDLTRTTLKAILKYPWTEQEAWRTNEAKFCIYNDDEDRHVFEWLFDGGGAKRTLATDILDAADDIAYAVHDFEDGVWAQMIPLSRLLDDRDDSARKALAKKLRTRKKEAAVFEGFDIEKLLKKFFRDLRLYQQLWARRPFERTREARAALKNLSAALTGMFIDEITDSEKFKGMSDDLRRRLYLLTGMAWVWMIENPSQETLRFGQRRLVEDLFEGYWANPNMLPNREAWEEAKATGPTADDRKLSGAGQKADPETLSIWRKKARLICDHVSGMTDLYALHMHAGVPQLEPGFGYVARQKPCK